MRCPVDSHECELPLCNEVSEDPTCAQAAKHLAASFLHLGMVEGLIDPRAGDNRITDLRVDLTGESLEGMLKVASALGLDEVSFIRYVNRLSSTPGTSFTVEVDE